MSELYDFDNLPEWLQSAWKLAPSIARKAQVERSALIERATTAERERDEARAELERVKAERDAALVKIKVLFNVAHDAVGHVSAANYPERESLAHKRIDDCYDGKP